MSYEELYLNKRLITFFKELGYVRGIVPQEETSRKHLKWLIETCMLVDANTEEEMRVIFVKYPTIFIFFYFSYFSSIHIDNLSIVMYRLNEV